MILGADCTHGGTEGEAAFARPCGRPATFVRYSIETARPIAVLCQDHSRKGDVLIPAGTIRAEGQTFWLQREASRALRPDEPRPWPRRREGRER